MNKKDIEKKKLQARELYMAGTPQKDIATRIGISATTISAWVNDERWATLRAGVQITRPELVNKALGAVNRLLDQIYESNDMDIVSKLPDQLAKFASFIDKLDKGANIVSVIDVFIAFSKWIQHRASFDPEITPEFIATLNRYHDMYIKEQM
jgi:transcriptional regulator with XRE-family HTH domain